MPPRPMMALASLLAGALLAGACSSPAGKIRPVIYADMGEAAMAMRNAPEILMVRISETRLTGDTREVAKPEEVGGPMTPTIPLHLARITADVLITVRGQARTTVEFYSWIWASGSHGGPRLFHPDPGGIRLMFLRYEGGYLHTVGDYPSYDLEFRAAWAPAILSAWETGKLSGADPLERLVALRLRAVIEDLTAKQLREVFGDDGPRVNHHWDRDMIDLIRIVGPLVVVSELDDICLHSNNPSARFAACYLTAVNFPGRCKAYQLAQQATADGFGGAYLARPFNSCMKDEKHTIGELRWGTGLQWRYFGPIWAQQHHREALHVYTNAMDPAVRRAACELASTTSDARDFAECAGLGK